MDKLEQEKLYCLQTTRAACLAIQDELNLVPGMDYIPRPYAGARVITLRLQRMNPKNARRVRKIQDTLPQWLRLEFGQGVRIAQDSGDLIIEIPKPKHTWRIVSMAMLGRLAPVDGGIPIGEGAFGRIMTIPALSSDFNHGLWAGRSRSGKTANQMLFAYQVIKKNLGKIAIIDVAKKGEDWHRLDNVTQLITPPIYEMEQAERFLAWLDGELVRRSRLQGHRHEKIWVFVDELATITALGEHNAILKEWARVGSSLGIHLMAATQRPDKEALPKHINANMAYRVTGAVANSNESFYALGQKMGGAETLTGYGDMIGVAGDGRLQRFTGGLVTSQDWDGLERGTHRDVLDNATGTTASYSGYSANIPDPPKRTTPVEKKAAGRPSRELTIDELTWALFTCPSLRGAMNEHKMGAQAAQRLLNLAGKFRNSALKQGFLELPDCGNRLPEGNKANG